MKNAKVAFVILHYLALEETVACVDSIVNEVDYEEKYIVIVNNGLKNPKDHETLECLKDDKHIFLIDADKNLGYANGISLGFSYAKKQLQCDFIVGMNNDILIHQNDFIHKILRAYDDTGFAVAGPKILCRDGETDSKSNPRAYSDFAKKKVYFWIVLAYLRLILSYVNLDAVLESFVAKLRANRNGAASAKEQEDTQSTSPKYIDHCQLHGCCFIFSPKYVERFDGLVPQQSLYLEEEILSVRLLNDHLKAIYIPELELIHLENVSTDMIAKTNKKKTRFVYKNQIKSYKILLREAKILWNK